jgi:hypothetical protein
MSADQSDDNGKRQDDENVPHSPLTSSETNGQPATEKQNCASQLPMWKDSQWWQVWMQAVLIPVGIYALIIYFGQLDEMQKATKAATDGLAMTRDMAHVDQRAWVADSALVGTPELDKPFTIRVTIKNTGKTFAQHFVGLMGVKGKELSQPDPDFEEILAGAKGGISIGLVPPNGSVIEEIAFMDGKRMTQGDLDIIKSPMSVILVFGKIAYADIFRCEHWTTYCYRVRGDGSYETYTAYNDADDNCLPKEART